MKPDYIIIDDIHDSTFTDPRKLAAYRRVHELLLRDAVQIPCPECAETFPRLFPKIDVSEYVIGVDPGAGDASKVVVLTCGVCK